MKRKTILFISILQLLVITGCYDDLGNYDYTNSTKVSFVNSASSDYTFMVGDLFEMDAPINFSTDIGNVDELFTVQWYLNRELIYTGYHLKYQFEKGGTYELILKVINKETNETYISNKYTLTGKNSFDWGWMILSNKGDGKSSLSFSFLHHFPYIGPSRNFTDQPAFRLPLKRYYHIPPNLRCSRLLKLPHF